MSLWERFQKSKEEGFRTEFIKPLLIRMGFVGISNNHGQREFGKDFVFSELDRFGQLRHMIVQAKHLKSIRQGKVVSELSEQLKQAFRVPFYLPSAPHEQRRVSAVYVFNTGKIQENARTDICGTVHPTLQPNVHFYDGDQLETLWNSVGQRHDEGTRGRLVGLVNQLLLNADLFEKIITTPDHVLVLDVRGPFLHGMEAFLSDPIAPNHVPPLEMLKLWSRSKTIEAIQAKLYMIPQEVEQRAHDMRLLKHMCREAKQLAVDLMIAIGGAIDALPPTTID